MDKINNNKKVNILRILLLVTPVAAAILLKVYYEPFCALLPKVPECVFHRLGLLCPGCGATRAFLALFWGKVLKSIRLNPIVFVGAVMFALFYVEQLFALFGKRIKLLPRNKWFYIILGVLFLLYFVLRNFPAFAFLTLPNI